MAERDRCGHVSRPRTRSFADGCLRMAKSEIGQRPYFARLCQARIAGAEELGRQLKKMCAPLSTMASDGVGVGFAVDQRGPPVLDSGQ